MSFVLLGILNSQAAAGGFAATYRLQTLGGVSFDEYLGVALDAENNLYAMGGTNSTGAGSQDFLLVKYDTTGSIVWQRVLGTSGFDFRGGVVTDSGNNVYFIGRNGDNKAQLAKYNSSGTLVWQRELDGGSSDQGQAIAIDSADNVYVGGQAETGSSGFADFLIAKYNSSGTIQWQRYLGSSNSENVQGLTIDSADNVYAIGATLIGSDDHFLLAMAKDFRRCWQFRRYCGSYGLSR